MVFGIGYWVSNGGGIVEYWGELCQMYVQLCVSARSPITSERPALTGVHYFYC